MEFRLTAADKFVAHLIDRAPKHWLKSSDNGSHVMMPQIHLLLPNETVAILALPFENDQEKYAMADLAREFAQQHRAVVAGLLVEGWRARYDANPDTKDPNFVWPADRSDRDEVLSLGFQYSDREDRCMFWPILRGPGGRAALGERTEMRMETETFRGLVVKVRPN